MDDLHSLAATIALVAGLAWASGLRLYLTLFAIGLLSHFQLVVLPPALEVLGHPWALAASGIMVIVEFLADKLPGFDSVWDGVHTFIRIPAGAILAGAAVGYADPVLVTVAAILGGAIASGAHLAKAGTRALINTSPEPFSNWTASLGEDALLVGGLWLMFMHPLLFLAALLVFTALVIWLVPKLFRAVRALFRSRVHQG
jgi:hypothetical protein